MPGPLHHARVVELAGFISGPYAGMLLADLGAEVVKIEHPVGGDPFRKWGDHAASVRPQFAAYNRGKKSLSLDIKTDPGKEVLRRLVSQADILIENFRPGTLDRLGLGYDDLRDGNPRLVYCAISGMGPTGPYAKRPSYESIGLGLSGLWSRLTNLTQPRPIGPNIADQLTSLYAVYGVLGAYSQALRTGRGQRVDVSMLLANMAFLPEPIANYTMLGEVGDLDTRARRSQAYALLASDGLPIAIHLSSVPKFWEGLVRALEQPGLLQDPRFQTLRGRIQHYDELHALLVGWFSGKSRAEWLQRLATEDVPAAPIYSLDEVLRDPQVVHLGAIREYGSGERAVRLIRRPVDYSDSSAEGNLPPPQLGEHTDEIMTTLGYAASEVLRLREEGIVGS